MSKNYDDVVRAMTEATRDGRDVARVILTNDSISSLMTDAEIGEQTQHHHNQLGEFELPVEEGDENVLITEDGDRYKL